MKIAWKYINGHGPYAYVQRTVRDGDSTTSEHVAYLGCAGGNLKAGQTSHHSLLDTKPDARFSTRSLRREVSRRAWGGLG